LNPGCYNPAQQFKPQWAYATPAGSRDEIYQVPFSLNFTANGTLFQNLPVQLDDDVPFVLRAILFPNCGPFAGGSIVPALIRIRDTEGNPISDGLVLAAGAYGLSGFANDNAFGFPVEPEILCAPGGSILFDVQANSNGAGSSATIVNGGDQLTFYAQIMGAAGNGLTIQLIDPGAPNVALSAALVGGIHVQVTLATDGGGAITSTFAQIAAIINSTAAVAAKMGAVASPLTSVAVATAVAQTPLTGGTNGVAAILNGSLLGVKRFSECNQ
jgi:hypothetical protein